MLEFNSGRISSSGKFTYLSRLVSSNQANKILMERIEDDQFLNLMTVQTEVRSVCKEPYRSNHESYFHYLVYVVACLFKPIILVMSWYHYMLQVGKFYVYYLWLSSWLGDLLLCGESDLCRCFSLIFSGIKHFLFATNLAIFSDGLFQVLL